MNNEILTTAHEDAIAGFMADILKRPDDDTPRLVLADWLDEHGDPDRAEFIQVRHKLEEFRVFSDVGGGKGLADLLQRDLELWNRHYKDWLPDLPGLHKVLAGWTQQTVRDDGETTFVGPDLVVRAETRCGFVSHVTCTAAVFLGGEICEAVRGNAGMYDRQRWHRSYRCDCGKCDGEGHTIGIAADLFRAQPVERVTLTDREPERIGNSWVWFRQGNLAGRERSTLPRDIYDRMYHLVRPGSTYAPQRCRATSSLFKDVLTNALSDALVAYGREKAGLPEWRIVR